ITHTAQDVSQLEFGGDAHRRISQKLLAARERPASPHRATAHRSSPSRSGQHQQRSGGCAGHFSEDGRGASYPDYVKADPPDLQWTRPLRRPTRHRGTVITCSYPHRSDAALRVGIWCPVPFNRLERSRVITVHTTLCPLLGEEGHFLFG